MEPHLSDEFLDRVRRAYCFALDAGARTRGHTWKSIDRRRADVHSALVSEGNAALRAVFIDPTATDLYFGVDNLCRSVTGTSGGRPFLELALLSARAARARSQAAHLLDAIEARSDASAIEIGPGMGHCVFYAYRAGLTDYSTIDLPLGMVAQARFLADAIGPDKIWMDGEAPPVREQIKLFSTARMPQRTFDIALNADSLTEMSLETALGYIDWINRNARMFVSINHEVNPFTVAAITHCRLAGERVERVPVTDRPGYFQESFRVDGRANNKFAGLLWLRASTLFWSIATPIRWRVPLLRPKIVPGEITQSASCS